MCSVFYFDPSRFTWLLYLIMCICFTGSWKLYCDARDVILWPMFINVLQLLFKFHLFCSHFDSNKMIAAKCYRRYGSCAKIRYWNGPPAGMGKIDVTETTAKQNKIISFIILGVCCYCCISAKCYVIVVKIHRDDIMSMNSRKGLVYWKLLIMQVHHV